jgi:two-component system, chemotaxis family, chemotaxis protein CheY
MKPERARLLIVDDSRMIRKVLRGLMQTIGFNNIDEAPDGARALDLLNMTAYDLVLSDWNMPRLSGLELLRTIRHGTQRNHTAMLLISGDVSAARMVEAIESGANGFVPKPFVARALCDQVLKIIAAVPPSESQTTRATGALHAGL